jgi:hypothetical protein
VYTLNSVCVQPVCVYTLNSVCVQPVRGLRYGNGNSRYYSGVNERMLVEGRAKDLGVHSMSTTAV